MRIIMEKTAAATSAVIEVGKMATEMPRLPVTLFVVGGAVATSKAIAIKYADDTGSTRAWLQLKKGGDNVVLDEDNNFVVIDFPGIFQISKPDDGGDVGVAIA